MSKFSFLRINSTGEIPQTFTNIDDYKSGELYEQMRPLFSHYKEGERITLGRTKYALWCSDGKRYNVEIFYDDEGLQKILLPNHRANAMITAGRFTNKKFDYVSDTRNQDIKNTWGSNYFVGDIICKITSGKPIPDCSIYGDNPIKFILRPRAANTRMKNKHGIEKAHYLISPLHAKVMPTGMVSFEMLENADWELKDYHIYPKVCNDEEYKELVGDWCSGD